MIFFCNKNKVGVDCFDQMVRLYTNRTATQRCPMSVSGNMLDIAAINAWVLYKSSTQKQIIQQKFILLLVKKLTNRMEKICPGSDIPQSRPTSITTRKRRHFHGANCNNMNVTLCIKCNCLSCGSCSENNTNILYHVTCKKFFFVTVVSRSFIIFK